MDRLNPGGGVIESAAQRLGRVLRTEPLLKQWLGAGILSDAEAELVWLLIDGADQGHPMRVATPGRAARLAVSAAVMLSVRQLTHPGTRQPLGTVGLVGAGPAHRRILADLSVGHENVVSSIGIVRLRRDGLVERFAGGSPRPLASTDRLVVVSDRVGRPECGPLGPVVIDELGAGNSFVPLHQWALERSAVLHVVAPLHPGAGTAGFVADWPLIAGEPGRWPSGYGDAWGIRPSTTFHPVTPVPFGLGSARGRLADLARTVGATPWPDAIRNAAALSRQLMTLAVSPDDYDTCTRGSIAIPIAERAEQLRATRASDLPAGWRGFAETGWAPLKQDLLAALEDLESHNPKSDAIGLLIEKLLAEGAAIEVWVDNGVHVRALVNYLVSAGFGITPAHLDGGQLAFHAFGDPLREQPCGTSLISGLPAPWQLGRLVGSDFGAPLHVVSYDFEQRRAASALAWVVNDDRVGHARERDGVYRQLLGDVACPPPPAALDSATWSVEPAMTGEVAAHDWGADAAEFAALADDDWLGALSGGGSRPASRSLAEVIGVRAFLVQPGPAVLLVRAAQILDRVVGGRVRPTPAAALSPGMTILGLGASGVSLFERLRPYLERVRGPGTQFWLEQWSDALRTAATKMGGPIALAASLEEIGATITAGAVSGWASPYRIGPRDPANVARVAQLGDHPVVAHHATRVSAVMRGVRTEHHRLGRSLARAVRRNAAGDADAFDEIEDRLGISVSALAEDLSTYTVVEAFGSGTATAGATGRLLTIAEAHTVFHPEEVPT